MSLGRAGLCRRQDRPGGSDHRALSPVSGTTRGARGGSGPRPLGPGRGRRAGSSDRSTDPRVGADRDGVLVTVGAESASAGGFAVELPVFTGPFRLLADLILEQKIDVCDVSVATVTDGFLARSKEEDTWNLEEATWFLAICSVLLELKVGRLMPRHAEPDEEDIVGGSPDLVYARSLELAAF